MSEMGEEVGKFVPVREDGELVEDPTDGRFGLGAGGSQSAEIVEITGLGAIQCGVNLELDLAVSGHETDFKEMPVIPSFRTGATITATSS